MAARLRVSAVRPYPKRIRSRVVDALREIGAETSVLVDAGASDDIAISAIRAASCDVLLIPFHAHRDSNGALVHGLRLIERIRAELVGHRQTPILCPVSNQGLAAAGLMSARQQGPRFDSVLFIEEDVLEAGDAVRLIRGFLRASLR